MSIWTIVLLIIIIGPWIFELFVEHLNVKHATPNLPDELKDVYDEEKYKTSQNYLKAGTNFGTVSTSIISFS